MRRVWRVGVLAVWVTAGCAVRWPRSLTEGRDVGEEVGLDAADAVEAGDVRGDDSDAGEDRRDATDATTEVREDTAEDREGVDSFDVDAPAAPDTDVLVAPDADVPVAPDADVPLVADADAPLDTLDSPEVPGGDASDAGDTPDACVGATCVYASCAELPAGSMSGVYNLRTFSGGTWRGYCEVTTDGSPAWTLVMKVDGAQTTFQYDAVHWYTGSRYNDAVVDLSETEAKYEGYNSTPFREIRLQTSTAGLGQRDVVISVMPPAAPAVSIASVMQMRSTPPTFITGTSAWGAAFPGATLQSACTRFGFNVRSLSDAGTNRARVRIGGVGDDDGACGSPDSWVGVGGFVDNPACTPMGNTLSAGNVSGCDGTSPRRAASFVWIWVR